jgi:hypothetical protein
MPYGTPVFIYKAYEQQVKWQEKFSQFSLTWLSCRLNPILLALLYPNLAVRR